MSTESKTVYFDGRGPDYTDETLRLAKARADELGIEDIVLASYRGWTGVKALEVFDGGYNVVIVAGVVGFREPNEHRMTDENRALIEAKGGKILFHGHSFGMLGRAVKNKFGPMQVDEFIAHTLRLFCQGVKVCCEISCMAADAGLIETGKEIIALGGSGRGADTAMVMRASNTHTFFDTRIQEIVCKPRG